MRILVTGAKGFVGRNLCAALKNIRDGKDRTRLDLRIDEVLEFDIDTPAELLNDYCQKADFVFNLAGVNRPKEQSEFMEGNFGFASTLLDTLKKHGNRCPVMLASSQQASLTGRYGDSEYGRSKKAGEDLFLRYEEDFLKVTTDDTDISDNKVTTDEKDILDNRVNTDKTDISDNRVTTDDTDISDKKESVRSEQSVFKNKIEFGQSVFKNKIEFGQPVFRNSKGLTPRVLIYRFPNLFGKWCQPNYNSAVATFCYNIAHDLPIQVNDPNVELELLYIDDLVTEMLNALEGKEHRCEFEGLEVIPTTDNTDLTDNTDKKESVQSEQSVVKKGKYCYCPITHKATLGKIVELLHLFAKNTPSPFGEGWGEAPFMPDIPNGAFTKKLYSTYLSYLPKGKVAFPLKMNVDERGSFTELLKTAKCGQFSVNISKPGITKGQHWHNSKWELFLVVSGHGLIQERKVGTDEVIEFEVSGDKIEAVHMLPGYTHNIINLSDTENLVTLMWANELFDPDKPDTYFEKV